MTYPQPLRDEKSEWPFSRPALMAGLRRYLVAPSLELRDIQPMDLPAVLPGRSPHPFSTLRGMSVGVVIDGVAQRIALVLKEAPITDDGRVLSALGQREYGVYQRLAPHLPLLVPGLVAGDPLQGWIIVEALTGLLSPDSWTTVDYQEAIYNLAIMHDRFWGLGEDLAMFPWLGRSIEADYRETVIAAAEAAKTLIQEEPLVELATPRYYYAFGTLVQNADEIIAPLREETPTLLHGDYWPGNIACRINGRQIVFDWQLASIGPGILDLVIFVQTTAMSLQPTMPASDLIALYRGEMARCVQPAWDDERFDLLWDHALLWVFLSNWLRRLATLGPTGYAALSPRFTTCWLQPMIAAMERRLDLTLPD